ncbi:MAG: phage holin family protein [Clostridia bacterium]|nr:phage holin family protein [Clostridia bacterium]
MEKLKYLIALIGGLLLTELKLYGPIFIAVVVMCAFDFFTGIAAAKMTGVGWNSAKARKGVMKKGLMLCMLLFGVALDVIIPMAAEHIGIQLAVGPLLFSSIIGFYIIFTEAISVCENFYACNPNSFPRWIVKLLTAGKEQIDKLGDGFEKDGEPHD